LCSAGLPRAAAAAGAPAVATPNPSAT
jgi:hypothetical protein